MKKVILDCDPGMDDSMAIIMAAKSPQLKLLAVTTVSGNYPVHVTSTNARKILEMLGRQDIPAAKGMDRPMVRPAPPDPFTHGSDGQAENFLPEPAMPLAKEHAVDLMIRLVKENPGEVTVLCTGPMTNLAMALVKEPELAHQIASIVAVSGAFGLNPYAFLNATGDTPQSEWNVYVDPEAARIVYESGISLTALGLDVATHFDVNFSQADIAAFAASSRPEAQFLSQAIRFVTGRGFEAYTTIIDCIAVAFAIDPSLVQTIRGRVGIETQSPLTLGMTVLDRRHHHAWEHLPMVEIGTEADYRRFLNLLRDLVLQ